MKKLLFLLAFWSSFAFSGGWTNTAAIEHVEMIRGQGFQIRGQFDNPSNCTAKDYLFVAMTHPQYDQLLTVVMSAMMAGKKIRAYSHKCAEYGWHGGTYNELTGGGSLYIIN